MGIDLITVSDPSTSFLSVDNVDKLHPVSEGFSSNVKTINNRRLPLGKGERVGACVGGGVGDIGFLVGRGLGRPVVGRGLGRRVEGLGVGIGIGFVIF